MSLRWSAEDYQRYLSKNEPKKVSKYRSKKVKVDGILFDSQKEADYYMELKLLTQAGEVKGFCRQPRFVVTNGDDNVSATEYVADFIVFQNDGSFKIVDTKGVETAAFKLKKKSFHEKYPSLNIEIR